MAHGPLVLKPGLKVTKVSSIARSSCDTFSSIGIEIKIDESRAFTMIIYYKRSITY